MSNIYNFSLKGWLILLKIWQKQLGDSSLNYQLETSKLVAPFLLVVPTTHSALEQQYCFKKKFWRKNTSVEYLLRITFWPSFRKIHWGFMDKSLLFFLQWEYTKIFATLAILYFFRSVLGEFFCTKEIQYVQKSQIFWLIPTGKSKTKI